MPLPNAGEEIEASDWTDVFPVGVDAWTPYVPTLVQSGAVTKTVSYASYTKIGRFVIGQVVLVCTGAGSANNEVRIGLPVAAANVQSQTIGEGHIIDVSAANASYKGLSILQNANYLTLLDTSVNTYTMLGATGAAFTAALASGDFVRAGFWYESAA